MIYVICFALLIVIAYLVLCHWFNRSMKAWEMACDAEDAGFRASNRAKNAADID